MEAARNGLTTTGKRKVRASNALQRKPFADRTNAPLSQSSPIPKPLNVRAAEDVAATGSLYTRRKCRSGRSASLVARLVENVVLFKYSTEEEEEANPPSMLSKSLTGPPRKKRMQQGSSDVLPQDFIEKQRAYFAEIDAFDLTVAVASSDELD